MSPWTVADLRAPLGRQYVRLLFATLGGWCCFWLPHLYFFWEWRQFMKEESQISDFGLLCEFIPKPPGNVPQKSLSKGWRRGWGFSIWLEVVRLLEVDYSPPTLGWMLVSHWIYVAAMNNACLLHNYLTTGWYPGGLKKTFWIYFLQDKVLTLKGYENNNSFKIQWLNPFDVCASYTLLV